MYLEHVNMTVSDVARSIEFYRRVLGLNVRWEGTSSSGRPAAHIGGARDYIALFEAATAGRAAADYDRVGLNHVGFVVDDLDAVKDRLAALGITPHLEADYDPGRRLYFYDPDGVEVELVTYAADAG
ncbi:MAG: VOC family protein [Phycisphaerae bacterium]